MMIKRLLKKYKYPPDGQDDAAAPMIKQAEVLAEGWGNDEPYINHDIKYRSLTRHSRFGDGAMGEELEEGDQLMDQLADELMEYTNTN